MINKIQSKKMNKALILISIIIVARFSLRCQSGLTSEMWVTDPANNSFLVKKELIASHGNKEDLISTIKINPDIKYQTMDGFGFTLTGGSARLINVLKPETRDELLKELFTVENGIGINYLRISVGASDLSDSVFTYNELLPGEEDIAQLHFNMDMEKVHLIPVIKQILRLNPDIKIMGSPWTAPTWMKTNQSYIGGNLKHKYFSSYALYFKKYINEMAAEGINIDAITIQNEPLHPGNNPSMYMSAEDQAKFIKNHLGPLFDSSNIATKIIIYDHNADRPDYPISILNDKEARKFVDGSAFHLYGGTIDRLSEVQKQHPDKNLYFTEQWIGAPGNFPEDLKWHTKNLIIGASRNWCKTVLEWNLAADANQKPHTDKGGCTRCLGAITIDKNEITRNPAYYIVGHASKFVPDGSVRIESNMIQEIPNVAFLTPEGRKVLIVLNDTEKMQGFNIELEGNSYAAELPSGAVGTIVF